MVHALISLNRYKVVFCSICIPQHINSKNTVDPHHVCSVGREASLPLVRVVWTQQGAVLLSREPQ